MRLSTRQVSLLNEMGIPVWQQRLTRPLAASQHASLPENTVLIAKVEQAEWLWVVDDESPAALQLLRRIGHALSLSEQQYCIVTSSESSILMADMAQQIEHNQVILFFGVESAQVWCDHYQNTNTPHQLMAMTQSSMATIISHSLKAVLADAQLKSQLWRDLLQAKQYLERA